MVTGEQRSGHRCFVGGLKAYSRTREETGEFLMAVTGFSSHLQREVNHPIRRYHVKLRYSSNPLALSGPEGIISHGVMDLVPRKHILDLTLSCPGLAASDSGNTKRCGLGEGTETGADAIAWESLSPDARVGHLHPRSSEQQHR